jgi:hypothetical protein
MNAIAEGLLDLQYEVERGSDAYWSIQWLISEAHDTE